ncbi:putative low-complexity protein [Cylindrospermum stagnale PCC 7417]|uniref:Putative low-complexity protein n=1 Tax=Cylindrospermum stagnale PCC 7417 TaxID=56107 RepID=K9WQN8_9NOST|nr:putative low-complexity protein [Cylindrospermum stagnale PCC 7417]
MPPDYDRQNLRGRSFKGQNLTGANFSKADIRGADFTNANLKGADLSGARAGLQYHSVIWLLIVSWLLSGLLGFFSIFMGVWIAVIFEAFKTDKTQIFIIGVVSLVLVALFCIVTIRKGFTAGLGAFAFVIIVAMAVAFAGDIAGAVAGAIAGGITIGITTSIINATAFAFAISIAGVFAGVGVFVSSYAGVFAGAIATDFVGVTTRVYQAIAINYAMAIIDAFIFTLFTIYIGWGSLTKNEKYTLVRLVALTLAATGGTSFRGADLTDADFTGAILKNTDFRTANLTRTRFYEAKKLDFARPGNTILTNRAVLNLLISCNGRGKSYVGANLRGANLKGADLKEANLKDADIIEATFQGACLEWANLTLAQAVGTNFSNTQMTGACVEAWNIENTTILDNVDCRFVYLLDNPKPGTDDRERRPNSG